MSDPKAPFPFSPPSPIDHHWGDMAIIVAARESRCPWRANAYSAPWHDPNWLECRAQELARGSTVITTIGDPEPEDT